MQNQNGRLDSLYTENPQLWTVLFPLIHVSQQTTDWLLSDFSEIAYTYALHHKDK